MSIIENKGVLTYKDTNGNLYRMYPVTTRDCLLGMDYVDAHISDRNNIHKVTASQTGAVPIERTINGHALSKNLTLQPADLNIALDKTMSIEGAYAEANAVGEIVKEITSDVLSKYNSAIQVAQSAETTAQSAKTTADGKVAMKTAVVLLPADMWTDNTLTVSVQMATKNNTVIVGATPDTIKWYAESGVFCSGQSDGSLTFRCFEAPKTDLLVNIIFLE